MSTDILPDLGEQLTPVCTLTLFPRMEWPKRWSSPVVPTPGGSGTGWRETMLRLLYVERITKADDPHRRDRRVGKGEAAKPLVAKECARGLAPYTLGYGHRRCKAHVLAADTWSFAVHDIDAAPLVVNEMLAVVERALGHLAHASWTTWSCRDGYASARVFLLLSRTCTTDEASAIWWWTRRLLVTAGMPEDSAKAGEPTMDSRAMDGRLFYGPSVPTPMLTGVERWGGVVPRGLVTPDDVPPIDVDGILAEARKVRAEDEPVHLDRWPGVPVPGAGASRSTATSSTSASRSARPTGATRGPVKREDFAEVKFEGSTLLAWTEAHLAPGTEVNVGSPWRDDGGSGLSGRSLRLHRELDGRIWAKDFPTDTTYVHVLAGVAEEGFNDNEIKAFLESLVDDEVDPDGVVAYIDANLEEAIEDGAEADRRIALASAGLEERLKAKRAAGEALDPLLVEGARGALRLTRELLPLVRDHLRRAGLPAPEPCFTCGLALPTQHAHSGKVAAYRRGCGRFSCPMCGPVVVSRKLAAVLTVPIADEVGKVVGEPLGNRPLWAYEVIPKKEVKGRKKTIPVERRLNTFLKTWRKRRLEARFEASGATSSNRDQDDPHRGSRTRDAYVAFHLVDRVIVLSTHEVTGTKAGTLLARLADAKLIRDVVLWFGLATYRVVKDPVETERGKSVEVLGKIASSHGLTLEPADVARMASASAWLSILRGTVAPGAFAKAMKARGIDHNVALGDHGVIESATSTAFVEPGVAEEVAVAAGARPRALAVAPLVVLEDPRIAEVIAELTRNPDAGTVFELFGDSLASR